MSRFSFSADGQPIEDETWDATPSASVLKSLNRHARRREKVFGDGKPRPMSRNVKLRIMALGRVLMRPIASSKHYCEITAKHFAVLQALFDFCERRSESQHEPHLKHDAT